MLFWFGNNIIKRKPKAGLFLFCFCLICFTSDGLKKTAIAYAPKLIRVAIVKDADQFSLAIRGRFKIYDSGQKRLLDQARRLKEITVVPTSAGIKIGDLEISYKHVKIIPEKDATIYVNDRRFRGEINIVADQNNKLLAINTVELENYIKGVLYHEVSHRWPLESLKAQAVAARSYALYQADWNKKRLYDVTSDIYSQVYGGRNSEKYRTNIAVNRTKGLVMAYQGKILPAYYHATCGGHTEDVSELWNEDLPPLKGVVCSFCEKSPHYQWKKNYRLKDIQDGLNKRGYQIGLIKTIEVTQRNHSGRIKTIKITARDGKVIQIPGKEFRQVVGPNLLKSNYFDVEMKGYYFDLIGKGWGHGVGMCQWGANFMARERYNFRRILKFYYPGVEIVHHETIGL